LQVPGDPDTECGFAWLRGARASPRGALLGPGAIIGWAASG